MLFVLLRMCLDDLQFWYYYVQGNEYIIFIKLMFDLYLALVPLFSIITLLNLLSLKLALRDTLIITKIYQKQQNLHLSLKQNQQKCEAKTLLKYMLLHFSPLQFCTIRRARYKLAFFCSISITMLGSYFIQTPFAFAGVGTGVYLVYFFVTMLVTRPNSGSESQEENHEQCKAYRQKYLQVIFTIISSALNFTLIGLAFRNYKNSALTSFITNACINIALDNFLVRPIVITLIGLPLSRSQTVLNYVQQCEKQLKILQLYGQMGQKLLASKHGKLPSPGKIASRLPLDLQIQPAPIFPDQENRLQNITDAFKKIKNQRNFQCELTLNSLLNSTKKEQDFHAQEGLQVQRFQPKCSQNKEDQLKAKKKICSQNLLMIHPSRQQPQNQEEIATEQGVKGKLNQQSYVSAGHRETLEVSTKQRINQNQNEPVKISLQSSSQPSSRQQPLRICLNGQISLDDQQNYHDEEEIETGNYRKRRELHTIDQNYNKSTFGVLRIKEENYHHPSQQIEEVDLNSPEKRKRQQKHIQLQEDSKLGVVKRNKKKFSLDNNINRVIKFSTGQPYLQYLPQMLSKDNKGKKSQNISKKDIIVDSRATNSLKKPKKRLVSLQNNQNFVPEFKIQEL